MISLKTYTHTELVEDIAKRLCESSGQEYSERIRGRVEAKIMRRLNELGFATLIEYTDHFQLHEKGELKLLLALLTTQSTQFFGEYSHFEYLSEHFLKPLIPALRKRADKTLHVWSTACSRGQEAYSLAMFLKYALHSYGDDLNVRVVGTDSDSDAIKIAQAGSYPRVDMRDVPLQYLGNDWERATVAGVEMLRAKPALRKLVHFEYANLLGLKAKFPGQKFDLIFTRNVFSYFNESQIKESALELLTHLSIEGRFFVGISESLSHLGLPLESCGPSIYAFKGAESKRAVESAAALRELNIEQSLTKVFCVDDSPAVHTLMRYILKKEDGYQMIGSAMSVSDASRQISLLREADLITLNLQMRDENGILYLEQNFDDSHPPVLIVTSESKDHSELIHKALAIGEFEFVEKPILNQLSEHGETVRAKLRTILVARRNNVRAFRGQDQFKKAAVITVPEQKARVVIAGTSHLQKISGYLRELQGDQPPTYLFFEGIGSNLASLVHEIQRASGKQCQLLLEGQFRGNLNEVIVCDFKTMFSKVQAEHEKDKVSIAVLGDVGALSSQLILSWKGAQLILEDLGQGEAAETLKPHSQEIFPASSFVFLSSEYLK
jgi:chemotaxis protein methyltransferase CheR